MRLEMNRQCSTQDIPCQRRKGASFQTMRGGQRFESELVAKQRYEETRSWNARRDGTDRASWQVHSRNLPTASLFILRAGLDENLRNNLRDLVRCDAFYAAGIDAFHNVVIGSTTHDCAIHIGSRRIGRRVHQRKRSAAYRPIDVVACHRIGRTGGCGPTEVDRMCHCCTRTAESHIGRSARSRVAADGKLPGCGSRRGRLELNLQRQCLRRI
jgi:hypothetical protein